MKQIMLLIFCSIFLHAGLFDFRDISKAENSYKKGDYKSAISAYKKVQNKDGGAYDLANSYYKAKEYKKALSEYEKVSNPKLQFQKLHNMGNTYANLGKIDEAIKSYEEALKIKKDKDTQYNLDLLKKMKKKQQKKKKNKKKDKKKNKKKSKKNDKKKQKKGDNQKRDKNQKKQQNNKQKKKGQKDKGDKKKENKNQDKRQKQKQSKQKQDKKKGDKKKQQQVAKKKKVQPISDMEERKYKKMLNQRGINTLMLPLSTKQEKRNEENPW